MIRDHLSFSYWYHKHLPGGPSEETFLTFNTLSLLQPAPAQSDQRVDFFFVRPTGLLNVKCQIFLMDLVMYKLYFC